MDNIVVESNSIQVTEALRTMATKQARKLFRLGRKILHVRVSLETISKKKNDSQSAVVQYLVQVPGKDIVVRRRAKDVYLAMVEAAHHAARQLRRFKEKRLDSRRQPKPATPVFTLDDIHLTSP